MVGYVFSFPGGFLGRLVEDVEVKTTDEKKHSVKSRSLEMEKNWELVESHMLIQTSLISYELLGVGSRRGNSKEVSSLMSHVFCNQNFPASLG